MRDIIKIISLILVFFTLLTTAHAQQDWVIFGEYQKEVDIVVGDAYTLTVELLNTNPNESYEATVRLEGLPKGASFVVTSHTIPPSSSTLLTLIITTTNITPTGSYSVNIVEISSPPDVSTSTPLLVNVVPKKELSPEDFEVEKVTGISEEELKVNGLDVQEVESTKVEKSPGFGLIFGLAVLVLIYYRLR